MEALVADGLPRGGHPRRRRHAGLRDLRPVASSSCASAPDEIKAYMQRLPAPRPAAQGPRLQQHRAALPVPRVLLEPRRLAQAGAGAVGLPPRRAGRVVAAARSRSASGAGSCSSTWTPTSRVVRVVPRRLRRALGEVAAGEALQVGARRQGVRGQLEGAPGGVHGGVPRRRHAPAAARRHRRREQPVRLVGQLQPGDHAERHAEPAHQLRADRAGDVRRDERSAPRRATDRRARRRRHGPLDGRQRRAAALRAGCSAPPPTSCPTPSWPTRSTTRCSPTCTRGARTTGSPTGSARTATATTCRSWSACTSTRTTSRSRSRRPARSTGSASTTTGPRRPSWGCSPGCSTRTRYNLPKVQRGLASLRKDVTLANYQETKIRHFHHLLDEKLKD